MRATYDAIYLELREAIEDGVYPYQSFLPSETKLVERYQCAHNTARKALATLATEGYIQPIHGKGVRVIYGPTPGKNTRYSRYESTDIKPFRKVGELQGFDAGTKLLLMEEVVVDDELSELSSFPKGAKLMHFERLRTYDGKPYSRDTNYFRSDIVEGITAEEAERSIYRYIERQKGGRLVTCKRQVTVEPVNEQDVELLDLDGATHVAVIRVLAFDGNGMLCEYTEIRHNPNIFSLEQVAIRPRVIRD